MEKHCESKKRFGKGGAGTANDTELLEDFVREFHRKALKFAMRLSGNTEDAEELVQEALYRVIQAWGRYDRSKPLKPWFFTILRNAFLDGKRSRQHQWVALDAPISGKEGICYADVLSDHGGNLLQCMESADAVRTVRDALRSLPEEFQTVLRLHDMDGWKYDDIAQHLGIPTGTVRSRISRARRALRSLSPELAVPTE